MSDISRFLLQAQQQSVGEQVASPELIADRPASVSVAGSLVAESIETAKDIQDDIVFDALSRTEDPEEAMFRYRAAKAYAEIYGVAPAVVYGNLEAFAKDYFLKPPPVKTAWRAISDSFKAAKISIELGEVWSKYMGSRGIFSPATAKGDGGLARRAGALQAQMEQLQIDAMPRKWYQSWAKSIASAIPYTWEVAGSALMAVGATAAAGATAGLSSLAWFGALRSFVAATTSAVKGFEIMRGLEFADMISRGIKEEDALKWANVSGAFQSIIEAALGVESFVAGAVSKGAGTRIGERVLRKLFASGKMPTVAAKFVGRSLLDIPSEGLEEALQEVVSGFSKMAAQAASEEGVVFDKVTTEEIFGNAAKAFVEGAITAPILGLPGNVVMGFKDMRAATEMAGLARQMPKDEFKKAAVASGVFGAEGMSQEAQGDIADQVWEEQAKKEYEKGAEAAEATKAKAKSGKISPEDILVTPHYTPGRGKSGGSLTTYSGGRLEGGKSFADIDVEESDTSITITGGDIDADHVDKGVTVIAKIADMNEGKEIKISDEALRDPAIAGAYEKYIEEIGGQEANKARVTPGETEQLSHEDSVALARIGREVEEGIMAAGPENAKYVPGMANLAKALVKEAAKAAKVSVAKYTEKLAFGPSTYSKMRGRGVYGVTSFFTGGQDIEKFVKATVHIAVKAAEQPRMVQTMNHELMHYFRVWMSQNAYDENMAAVEKAYGIKKGETWSVYHDEKFVEDFERWVRDRKSVEPEKATIFQKIAKFINDMFTKLRGIPSVNPDVLAAMEAWFGKANIDTLVSEADMEPFKGKRSSIGRHRELAEFDEAEKLAKIKAAERKAKKKITEEDEPGLFEAAKKMADDLEAEIKGAGIADDSVVTGEMAAKVAMLDSLRSGAWVFDDAMVAAVSHDQKMTDFSKSFSEDGTITLFSEDPTVVGPDETADHTSYDRLQESQASQHKTLDGWLKALFTEEEYAALTEDDRKYFQARFDWAHKGGKAKRTYRKGEFASFLARGKNLSEFVSKIAKVVYNKRRYLTADTARHAERVEGAIARTPEIKTLVDKAGKDGSMPTPSEKSALIALVKRYEGLYKYLYALVDADADLANEALDDLNTIPEVVKREVTGNPARSLADNQDLIDAIEDDEILGKIRDKTITIDDIEALLAKYEEEAKAEGGISEAEAAAREKEAVAAEREKGKARTKAALDKLRAKVKARDKLRAYRAKVRRTIAFIQRTPSARVDLNFSAVIRLIQEYAMSGSGVDITKLRAAGSFIFARNDSHFDYIVAMVSSISTKPMGQWTMDQLTDLADVIDSLTREGRAAFRNRELFFGLEAKRSRNEILDQLRNSKYWNPEKYSKSSTDDIKRQERLKKKGILFDADRPDAFFNKYLGKAAAKLLFDDTVSVHRAKLENYDRRVKPVVDFLAESDLIRKKKLFEEVVIQGVGPEGSDLTITRSELVGIRMLIGTRTEYNAKQREALVYGNMFSGDEKNVDGGLTEENGFNTNAMMKAAYNDKLEALLAATEQMTEDEEKLAKLMLATMDNDQDWLRFAQAMYLMTNKEPKKEKFYFPMFRSGVFGEGEDSILSDLKSQGHTWVIDSGMAVERQDIQPRNQKEVQVDAIKVFFSAIQRQEHLTTVGPHAKKIKAVFKSPVFSETLQKGIVDSLGQKAWDYIDSQLEIITNPAEFKRAALGAEAFTLARGTMVVSNLAFRASSVLMQMMTSPLPFLSEAPFELGQVALEAMVNPLAFYKKIEEKSAILRHRQITPEVAILERRHEEGVATALQEISRLGMSPLALADRISVAIGWESVRRRKRAEGMSELDAQEYADRAVVKTQPTSDEMFRSPMYRNMDVFRQVILQFTQPLNVIWNNIRNDIPAALRDHEYGKAIGFIAAYALSGLAIGAIGVLRGRGPEDPDEEAWARYWIHSSTSQFTDSVPFLGSYITGLTGTLITGDNNAWLRNDTNMPAADLLARAFEGLAAEEKNWEKIATNAAMGLGMMVGAPTRAIKETVDLVKKSTGE